MRWKENMWGLKRGKEEAEDLEEGKKAEEVEGVWKRALIFTRSYNASSCFGGSVVFSHKLWEAWRNLTFCIEINWKNQDNVSLNLIGYVRHYTQAMCSPSVLCKAAIDILEQPIHHSCPSCPPGTHQHLCSCFLVKNRASLSWSDARIYCRGRGMVLASIHSHQENHFIKSGWCYVFSILVCSKLNIEFGVYYMIVF